MSVVHILSYEIGKLHAKLPLYGKKKVTLLEKCLLSVFFFFLALKSRAIILHGNKTNFYEELAFKCFFNSLHTKSLKRMENTLYGETEKHYPKHVF